VNEPPNFALNLYTKIITKLREKEKAAILLMIRINGFDLIVIVVIRIHEFIRYAVSKHVIYPDCKNAFIRSNDIIRPINIGELTFQGTRYKGFERERGTQL